MINFFLYLGISFSTLESGEPLSSLKKIEKIKEIKFDTKIKFQKTKGTDYLIAKEVGD
jgi:hypothetical protein